MYKAVQISEGLLYQTRYRCYEAKIEGSEKGRQPQEVEPRTPLAWAVSALPLSYSNQTTTNPHNPLYVHVLYSTGGSSQRCPGLDSQQLPSFSLSSYFCPITSKFLHFQRKARCSECLGTFRTLCHLVCAYQYYVYAWAYPSFLLSSILSSCT